MFLKWFLFETRIGSILLSLLERKAGLAIVDADWLGMQRCGVPTGMSEAQ